MQIIDQPDKTADDIDAQRAILTKSIDDNCRRGRERSEGCRSTFPVYIFVRSSGDFLWQRLPHRSIHPMPTGIMRRRSCAK